MDFKRINYILNNEEKCDVFYDERLVWIQGINNNNNTVKTIDIII